MPYTGPGKYPYWLSVGYNSATATRFGAWLDSTALGTSDWTTSEAAWNSITGISLGAGRWYNSASNFTISTSVNEMISAGHRVCITLEPAYSPVSSSDLTSLNTMLSTLKGMGADVQVTLWHEPALAGLTAAQYIAMYQYYGPTVRQYYPLWSVFSGSDTVEANGYFPGAAWVDGIAADCYGTGTANLDNCAAMADAHGLPLGLWEFNAAFDLGIATSPVSGATQAQDQAFLSYITNLFTTRTAAGKPNGDVLVFSGNSANTGISNFLGTSLSQTAGFEGGIGNWAAGANCSVAGTSAQAHSGTGALAVTSSSSSTLSFTHCATTLGGLTAHALAATPGQQLAATGWFRAATATRSCQVGIGWYDASGTHLSDSFGTTVADSTSSWGAAPWTATGTAPANTAWAVCKGQVVTPGGASEVHYFDDAQIGVLPASVDHTASVQFPWDYRVSLLSAIAAALTSTTASVHTERIPVIADGTTTYAMALVTAMATATWASGANAFLTFYDVNGTATGTSFVASSGSLPATSAGTTAWATTPLTAPGGSVSVQGTIVLNGTPSASNQLYVYQAQVQQAGNTSMPQALNANYGFALGTNSWSGSSAAIVTAGYSPLAAADGNFDSLVLADTIELMGGPGGTPSAVPELTDPASGLSAIYKISAPGGAVTLSMGSFGAVTGPYDLGTPQPTTDVVESLLLDGERPFGYRASNRTIQLPVLVFAPTLATLAAAREYLLSQIDQQTWNITWTPASTGLPMILECFRAQPSIVTYGFNYNREGNPAGNAYALSVVTLTIPALPYGKSGVDGTQQVTFVNGLTGSVAPRAPITIDNFGPTTAVIDAAAGWVLSTSQYKNGPTAVYHPAFSLRWPPVAPVYSRSGLSVNLSGLPVLSVWLGQGYDLQFSKEPKFISNITLSWTLTDASGHTLSFRSSAMRCPWGPDQYKPAWTRISARIPQNRPGFRYGNVTGYSVRITNWNGAGTTGLTRVIIWLDTLTASPLSVQQAATSPRGNVYAVYGLPGSARASVNAEVQLPATAPVTQEFTQSGTWTVPKGVTSVLAETWGGGGAGATISGVSATTLGGGGGGAEYAADTATVIPGVKVPVTVGAGGTPVFASALTALFSTAGTHKWTCPAGVTSVQAECWGGGAAGTAGGGGGGGGAYATNASVPVTAGKVYTITVGNGGKPNTGKTTADNNARNGASTSFPGDSLTVTALGGKSPTVGSSHGGDSGKGTNGANGVTVWWGGVGGPSPGGPGGGGGAAGSSAGRGAYGRSGSAATTGGGGGTGTSGGGSGGAGAGVPGTPVAGSVPGGGGGGGYTRSVNYQGAAGASGQVKLTYTPAVANGGNTTFGTSATASPVVLAHGGTSAASANTRNGQAGGSGSSNSVHFSGGSGGIPSGADALARYLHLNLGSLLTTLGSGAVTSPAAGFTSSAFGGSTASTGLAMAFVTTAAALSNPIVTDSAGNDYKLAASVAIPGGTAVTYVFYTSLTDAIPSGTTLTLANATSTTYGYLWYSSPYLIALEDGSALPSGTGTSSTAAVTIPAYSASAYPSGQNQFQVLLYANANTATFTAPGGVNNASGTATVTSGALIMNAYAIGTASPAALTWSAALSGSSGWAAIGLPFAAANQEELITRLASASSTTSTSSTVIALTTAPLFQVATTGYVIVITEAAATSTITVTDTASTTFTQVTQAQSGSAAFLHVHAGRPTAAYTTSSTITVSDNVSQTRTTKAYYLAGVSTFYDPSTTTGTGTSASITPTTGDGDGNVVLTVFASDASTAVGTPPAAPSVDLGLQSSTVFRVNPYLSKVAAPSDPGAVTATYGSSVTWGAIAVRFRVANVAPSGGGSSGGPGGAGSIAAPAAGGAAFTGGGKGAAGTGGGTNSPGVAASNPGGGGSGAKANTGTQLGGTGGNGLVRLTWQPPLRTFNDWILHRPSDGAPQALCPILSVPPSDPPDNREYVMPSVVPNANASFRGTYSVILVAHAFDSPGASRRVSVTINQYEYANGPAISVQATRTFTPNVHTVNGYLSMGEVTLPVKDYDAANTETYYTVSVHGTNQADSFQDALFLDTRGTTTFCNIAPGSAGDGQYSNYYLDEPYADRDLGSALGTAQGREHAISVLDMAFMTGGPLYVTAGDNTFLAYSTSGAPYLGLTYSPRWYVDRLQ